jgi:hypothetical protein
MEIMKTYKSVVAALAMSVLLVGLYGCQEGPAERAGKKIDKTVEKGGKQIEKAGKKIQDDVK